MTRNERNILVQSLAIFAIFFLYVVSLNIVTNLPDPTELQVTAVTLLWIVECGAGPILYLSMSNRVRTLCWKYVIRRSNALITPSTVTVTAGATMVTHRKGPTTRSTIG